MTVAKNDKSEKAATTTTEKSVAELVAEELTVDPTESDPRRAPEGTPIAFPDPDNPYPTEGDPYPPPATVMARGKAGEVKVEATSKKG